MKYRACSDVRDGVFEFWFCCWVSAKRLRSSVPVGGKSRVRASTQELRKYGLHNDVATHRAATISNPRLSPPWLGVLVTTGSLAEDRSFPPRRGTGSSGASITGPAGNSNA